MPISAKQSKQTSYFTTKMQQQSFNRPLILASSSRYRKQLLSRLGLEFTSISPDIDESRLEGEAPDAMTKRLAEEKALLLARLQPGSVVIGSDQAAVCNDRIMGKPGNADNAIRQLMGFSGQSVEFLTAVSVQCLETSFSATALVPTIARFRELTAAEAGRYVALDEPIDCAGGFKAEAAGVTLLRSLDSEDPTAIVGLPLIRLSVLLRRVGYRLP
jgi:septum formation protein